MVFWKDPGNLQGENNQCDLNKVASEDAVKCSHKLSEAATEGAL